MLCISQFHEHLLFANFMCFVYLSYIVRLSMLVNACVAMSLFSNCCDLKQQRDLINPYFKKKPLDKEYDAIKSFI